MTDQVIIVEGQLSKVEVTPPNQPTVEFGLTTIGLRGPEGRSARSGAAGLRRHCPAPPPGSPGPGPAPVAAPAPAPPAPAPAPEFLAPPPKHMTAKAGGLSYDAYVKAGWTDKMLVEHGYMEAF
jgi:hypothetical protein